MLGWAPLVVICPSQALVGGEDGLVSATKGGWGGGGEATQWASGAFSSEPKAAAHGCCVTKAPCVTKATAPTRLKTCHEMATLPDSVRSCFRHLHRVPAPLEKWGGVSVWWHYLNVMMCWPLRGIVTTGSW